MRRSSSSESLRPGISSVVISVQQCGLVHQVLQRVEHRLQVRAGQLEVEVVGERLQVDVGGVHHFEERAARLGVDVAGGDRHRLHARGVAGTRGVDRVLGEDHRVVVRERDAAAARSRPPPRRLPPGDAWSISRSMSRLFEMSQFWQNLQARLQPAVPNESTDEPGIEVVQRLLLDRVDAEARRAAVGRQHHRVARCAGARSTVRAGRRAACSRAGRGRTACGRRAARATTARDARLDGASSPRSTSRPSSSDTRISSDQKSAGSPAFAFRWRRKSRASGRCSHTWGRKVER